MQQRNTIQRQLVFLAVQALKNHPTAEEIYGHVTQSHPSVSRATVYRNLALLARQGAIRRVSHLDAADRFDFNTAAHYHFICDGCGKVFDVDTPADDDLLARPRNAGGFLYSGCAVTYTGLCPACLRERDKPA